MAQKVHVLLICDLHDEQDVEAAETAVFSVDGATYEIELCEDHGQQLRETVDPFVAAARRAGAGTRPSGGRAGRSTGRGPAAAAGAGGGAQAKVREWARAQGYTVSDRGRLSSDVTAAYEAAH